MSRKEIAGGTQVLIKTIPWRGVIGTYVRPTRGFGRLFGKHRVLVGDLVSGGTARVVTVSTVEEVQHVVDA
jgi:hypothetical protein